MRRCGFSLIVAAALLSGCTERNPDYDPDAGPDCRPGERRCASAVEAVEVCAESGAAWVAERDCFGGTDCTAGACLPEAEATRCATPLACDGATEVCTVVADPELPGRLGTYCLPPPVPAGRSGGQACTQHGECRSGWCFRRVCYEACVEASTCTNQQHECATLDVTVDGIREALAIHGCAPPASSP
jgi:hypothetical protein